MSDLNEDPPRPSPLPKEWERMKKENAELRAEVNQLALKLAFPVSDLLDWFAGQALAGFHNTGVLGPIDLASLCYEQALAMLKERQRLMKEDQEK